MRRIWPLLILVLLGAGIARGQQTLLVKSEGEDGTAKIRMIEVSYLDLQALVAALGGTCVDLYGRGGAGYSYPPPVNGGFRPAYPNNPNYPYYPPNTYPPVNPGFPPNMYPPYNPGYPPVNPGYPPNMYPPYNPAYPPAPPVNPAPGNGLNPNAPLAPFVPAGITAIVGIK